MGDLNDFEVMMRANGPRVYTLAIRLCGGNKADGDDLAQETFVKAWEHWGQFTGESEAATWLYRICVNTWKNRVRSEKRRFFLMHISIFGGRDEDDDAPRDLPAVDPPLENRLEQDQTQEQLQKAMSRLDSEDRVLLVMREMDEKSYEEIAEVLEVPLGTVRSRLSRAREKLVQEFSKITL